jgi:hypothetical protein
MHMTTPQSVTLFQQASEHGIALGCVDTDPTNFMQAIRETLVELGSLRRFGAQTGVSSLPCFFGERVSVSTE